MTIIPGLTVIGHKKPIEYPEPKKMMQYDEPIGPVRKPKIDLEIEVDKKHMKYSKELTDIQPTIIARQEKRKPK